MLSFWERMQPQKSKSKISLLGISLSHKRKLQLSEKQKDILVLERQTPDDAIFLLPVKKKS